MPQYQITSPEGKKFRVTAPEGATQEQVLTYAQQQFAGGTKGPLKSELPEVAPDELAQPDAHQELLAELHPAQKILIAAGRGLMDTGQGVTQLSLHALNKAGLVSDEEVQKYQDKVEHELAEYEKLSKNAPVLTGAGRLLGNLASTPIPGGVGASAGMRVATSAAANAAAAGAQFVPQGQSRGLNTAIGAAAGGLLQPIGEGAAYLGRKAINAGAGNLADPAAKEVIQAGAKEEVPVFADDVLKGVVGTAAKKASVIAEAVPLGTGSGRGKQNEAARKAAQRWLAKLGPGGNSDDYFEGVQESLQRQLTAFRKEASKRYDDASQALDPLGAVPTSNFDAALDASLKQEAARGSLANRDAIQTLQAFKAAPRGNFTVMRALRSDLGDAISDFYKGSNQTIGSKGVGLLQSAKEALEQDMQAFAGAKGNTAWKEADDFYKRNIVPFKKTRLKSLVKSAEPEQAYNFLIASGGLKSRSKLLYNSLDEEGRGLVRYGMVKEAIDKATIEGKPFSPARFAGSLENLENLTETFFSGRDKREFKGLIKLMRHIERAGQYAENPPTGQRVVAVAMAGGAYFQPEAAGVAVGLAASLKYLFQTKRGRNFLLAASASTPGTEDMERITNRITNLVSRSGSLAQAQPATPPQTDTPLQ